MDFDQEIKKQQLKRQQQMIQAKQCLNFFEEYLMNKMKKLLTSNVFCM